MFQAPKKCNRRLFAPSAGSTPILVENSRMFKPRQRKRLYVKSSKKLYKRLSIDKFEQTYSHILGKYTTELCKIQFAKKKLKSMRYSPYQKWMATNLLVGSSKIGYSILKQMFALPSHSTLLRYLKRFNSTPGIHVTNGTLVKMKVNPTSEKEKWCMLLVDEMSLRIGLSYDEKTGSLIGYEDDGCTKEGKLASSVLCVMVAGIFKRWKYPLGYIFTESVMKSAAINSTIRKAISVAEGAGFVVKGVTTDQGSNLEKTFRLLGVKQDRPFFKINNNKYYVYRDPPHLLKNSRNFLEKKIGVHIPKKTGKASWAHLQTLFHLDSSNSIKLAPKLTHNCLYDLRYGSRMKVKLAANVLSHSVAVALKYLVKTYKLEPSGKSTSSYCWWINRIFDALNSLSSKDAVALRRPLNVRSSHTIDVLKEAKEWLLRLELLNKSRRSRFISGWVQSINVVLSLAEEMPEHGLKFLPTRNLNQDFLEQFFGRIRSKCKYPTAHDFMRIYSRLNVASLVRPPRTGNCEVNDTPDEAVSFITFVS